MSRFTRHLANGVIAGATATTALNAATYVDMALRARPASSTPERTVERIAEITDTSLPKDPTKKKARASGLGELMGMSGGVATGIALGALRSTGRPKSVPATTAVALVAAMLASNAPMTALGVTNPRKWSAVSWAADLLPHFAFALAATATLDALERRRTA